MICQLLPHLIPNILAMRQDRNIGGKPVQDKGCIDLSLGLGEQHGLLRVYVKGQCLSEQTYAHGQLHGPSQSFDASGQVVARMPYVNGELEGLVQFYYEGSVMRRAQYRKGLLHGPSSDYDPQGDLVQECHFEANVLQGRLRRFWPNGEVMEELFYKNGKPVAPPKRYDAKGK
jgi:antitoxin component YwqK of YwqJK toxin-antitoxin module